jgi:hypothetical protein
MHYFRTVNTHNELTQTHRCQIRYQRHSKQPIEFDCIIIDDILQAVEQKYIKLKALNYVSFTCMIMVYLLIYAYSYLIFLHNYHESSATFRRFLPGFSYALGTWFVLHDLHHSYSPFVGIQIQHFKSYSHILN